MLFSVLTRKDMVSRHNFTLLRSCPGWEEAELCWWLPQGWVPRVCPATITEGARSPQAPQAACTAGQVPQTDLYRQPLPLGHRGRAGGEIHHYLRPGLGKWGTLVRSMEPCRTQPLFPGPPAHPLAQGQVNWWAPRQEERICLFPDSAVDNHCSTNLWLHGPLTVIYWQLLVCGRGPPRRWPVAEQGH